MLGTLERSTILRLRVKGSDLDPLALRGRLDSVLSDVSLEPRLPPSATLFIRKFEDPLPGSIQLDSPHARAPQAWRQAFQTRFDRLVSSAARPAHGYVADSAESVVFYDYAELLACLTADWCSGSALTRWWWQALLRRGDLSWLVRKFWREQSEYVPAALEHVVRKGVLVEFVSRLSDVEVREIVQRVLSTFGLTRILRIENADFFPVDVAPQYEQISQVRSEMPWRHVVPESVTPSLRPVQQFFIGIVLMVHRAPARVRTLTFAREVEQWIQSVASVASAVSVPPDQPSITEEQHIEIDEPFTPVEPQAPIRVNPIPSPPIIPPPAPPPKGSVSSAVKIANVTFHYEEPEPIVIEQTPVSLNQTETTTEQIEVTETISLDPATIETTLGGLFYLINLAIFLEIYNDFTSPVEQLHDDLSIWDFVTIVGKELDQETVDPIWDLLGNLADREDELITPEWLTDLLPHIRARLHLALGVDDDLPAILLHHEAKITITPTHLDVFFSLSDHPIEIRLSGLDRNPGWVPAAGRFIAFHYD